MNYENPSLEGKRPGTKKLITGIKIGIFLTLFTPLILGPFGLTFSAYPKAVFFRTLIEVILILYLILVYFEPEYLPKFSILVLVTSIFLGALFLSSLAGINFYRSFFGDFERAEGVILHLHLLIFFLIIISIFHKKREWLKLFKLTVIVGSISSLAGILQKLGTASFYGLSLPYRISGTLANPDFFGAYMVFAIFLGLFVLAIEKKKKLKILWISILVLNFFTLILSGTRAAWIGLVVGVMFLFSFWLFGYSRLKPKLTKRVLFGTLIFLIFILLIIINQERLSLDENYFFQRAISVFNIGSLSPRLPSWEIALKTWKEKPILGWGPECFTFLFDKFFKADYLQRIPETLFFDRPHNKILGLMATTGILGILSYLLIFAALFYLIFRHKKQKQNGSFPCLILAALLVSCLVQNFFGFDTISTYLIFFLIIGFVNNNFRKEFASVKAPAGPFGASSVNEEQKKREEERRDKKRKLKELFQLLTRKILKVLSLKSSKIILITVLISLSLIAIYQVNYKPTMASLFIIQGAELEGKDFSGALLNYKKGFSRNTIFDKDYRMEIIMRLITILEEGWAKKSEGEIIEVLSDSIPFLEKALEKPDKKYRNFYESLARINERIYLFSKDPEALEYMEEVSRRGLDFNNQRPQFYRLLGKVKIFQKEYQQGEAFFQKAFELGPGQPEDKITLYSKIGSAYFKADDKPKALENFKKSLDVRYFWRKYTAPAERVSLDQIAKEIKFLDSVAFLYYQELNDLETSQEIYEKAMEIYPEQRKLLQERLEILIKKQESEEK